MSKPRVSIITPTWNREAFLPALRACVESQDYENLEWLVHDDSATPSPSLSGASDGRLRYFHSDKRATIGEKRNILLANATGDIIVNFDDDDYYAPNYVSQRVQALEQSGAMLSISSGFFASHLNTGHFGYYRPHLKTGPAYQFYRNGVNLVQLEQIKIPYIHLCYGWSYVFWRELWDKAQFEDVSIFEDRAFTLQAMKIRPIHYYESRQIDAIHAIHNRSSSNCFPQFLIPRFMMGFHGPRPMQHIMWLTNIVRTLNTQD